MDRARAWGELESDELRFGKFVEGMLCWQKQGEFWAGAILLWEGTQVTEPSRAVTQKAPANRTQPHAPTV